MDLSQDYLLVDDPITVSYSVKTAESTWNAGVNVAYVQRNSLTKADIAGHPSLLEKDSSVFHLWTIPLNGIVPKIGDKLADSQNWVVKSVELCDRDANGVQRYRCIALRSQS